MCYDDLIRNYWGGWSSSPAPTWRIRDDDRSLSLPRSAHSSRERGERTQHQQQREELLLHHHSFITPDSPSRVCHIKRDRSRDIVSHPREPRKIALLPFIEKLSSYLFGGMRYRNWRSVLFLGVLVALFLDIYSGFSFMGRSRQHRRLLTPVQMALHMDIIELPLELNPARYSEKLFKIIPEDRILRWYIARIDSGKAILEVVYEMPQKTDKRMEN
jgi:hypothetical protein